MGINTGWVACNYTEGDTLTDVEHGPIRQSTDEAMADERAGNFEGLRWVHTDGYLYVDELAE